MEKTQSITLARYDESILIPVEIEAAFNTAVNQEWSEAKAVHGILCSNIQPGSEFVKVQIPVQIADKTGVYQSYVFVYQWEAIQ